MPILTMLESIRPGWVARVSQRVARGAGVRESFLEQINLLYGALTQSVETGDPAWIEHVLDNWTQSQTETDLLGDDASQTRILSEILLETQLYVSETLSQVEALELLGALLPLFAYAYEYATRRDINLRVEHVQRELETAQRQLEQLDRSKSDFISVAAHELKTPLTLIEGYTDMIREIFRGESDPTTYQATLLKGIDNGTLRLREIIDDMIDVSLLDNDLLSLNFQPVWIDRIVRNVGEELAGSIADRRQTLAIELFPGFEEMTFGDPERLFQAFKNLVVNAVKYTPDGGVIEIGGRKLPGFLEITVSDNGIGIDPANHTLIFEKFEQLGNVSLHSSGKTKFKGGGPGLGLPITKGLIEAHGGTIWVESEGQDEETCPGSVFHVMVPLRKDPPDARSARLFQSLVDGIQSP
jgi:signal transduction histidine kinase